MDLLLGFAEWFCRVVWEWCADGGFLRTAMALCWLTILIYLPHRIEEFFEITNLYSEVSSGVFQCFSGGSLVLGKFEAFIRSHEFCAVLWPFTLNIHVACTRFSFAGSKWNRLVETWSSLEPLASTNRFVVCELFGLGIFSKHPQNDVAGKWGEQRTLEHTKRRIF